MTTPPGTLPVDDSAVHTVREIAQQPALWREVDRIVGASREALDAFLDPLVARGDLRVVLTGAGTSAFAGQVLQPSLARHLGRRVDAVPTTDLVADPRGCLAEDLPTLLVSFARSGDSPESVAATALADQVLSEVHHLVITCSPWARTPATGSPNAWHGQRSRSSRTAPPTARPAPWWTAHPSASSSSAAAR